MKKQAVLDILTAPLLLGWVFPVLACLLFLGRWSSLRWESPLVLSGEWHPEIGKQWGYSTTLFKGLMYRPGYRDETREPSTRIERHEHVHVRQFEDAAVAGLLAGVVVWAATGRWEAVVILWPGMPVLLISQWLTSGLRGLNPYRGSEMERSAYSQTDEWAGSSWIARQDE